MSGYKLIKNAISEEQETELIDMINRGEWLDLYARRVQHFGYLYQYRTRGLSKLYKHDDPSKGIPSWILPECVTERISPDQIIVNEYLEGQGISRHRDAFCFGPRILSLSLGADTVMTFTGSTLSVDVKLPRRSLLVLEGSARYELDHEIKSHKGNTRYSITYRTLADGVTTS